VSVDGVPLPAVAVTAARTKYRVELGYGDNRIVVTARDRDGVESLEAVIAAQRDGVAEPELYVVAFGVSKYARRELALEYAASDAHAIVRTLRGLEGNGFRRVHATTFLDDEVTPGAIAEARQFLAAARVDDTVVIFVGGHGVLDPETGRYFYLPAGADPEHLAATSIGFDVLESLSYSTSSRRKLVLVDTCESGVAEAPELAAAARAKRLVGRSRSLARVARSQSGGYEVPSAFRRSNLFREAFRRSGAVVLSSSRGSESSYESTDLRSGLFSHAVIRALSSSATDRDGDGRISPTELEARVATEVAALSGDTQHPSIDRDNPLAQIRLPVTAPARPLGTRHPPPACGCTGASGSGGLAIVVLACAMRRRRRRVTCSG
jgi:uncharacterized caspase-like protein